MIKSELTAEDARMGMRTLDPQIDRYASLVVRTGVNVKPGQELVIQAPVETQDFVRKLVKHGYEAGAGHVTVIWGDDVVTRLTYEHMDVSYFEQTPEWQRIQLESLAEMGACFIFVEGSDPQALAGIDPAKPATASKARNTQCRAFRRGLDFNINPWCIAGAPVAAWAKQVFPDLCEEAAIYRLWCAILSVARADGDDPESDWELHDATFEKNLRFLNERHFDSLHFTSENGTDLTVGLTDKHLWAGGCGETPDGHPFFPNIPTEEVFTSPDCERVNGIVHSALPLIRYGSKVDGFWLRFENGVVVDYDAVVGRDVLTAILDTDEGARRLGEVALISKNTPISESGILFYDTLYDENASCHLALGIGFAECYEGGYEMTPEELRAHGVNTSSTHVDFMIGTDDMDIMGICADGTEVPVFVNGQWSWE
ncbi:aminopeptidase [Collinsella tanakaei]|uniref:aminopeptidase n=1 Tax=Collinsella tanakaei TaxID=626935 RepID=UPI0025A3C774|nr:aminopeptidase [Collinsella tanakaei]MDM8299457.1 aminopeptidase [Collinsella tanakaei]